MTTTPLPEGASTIARTPGNTTTRWGCSLCPGWTEKTHKPFMFVHEGTEHPVCDDCAETIGHDPDLPDPYVLESVAEFDQVLEALFRTQYARGLRQGRESTAHVTDPPLVDFF